MEIGPIPAIRTVATTKVRKSDPRFEGYLDVENAAAPKEDTFSRNEGETTGGQDDEPEQEEQTKPEGEEAAAADGTGATVNIFA